MTITEPLTVPETAPLIEELFCQGHPLETVVHLGAEHTDDPAAWTRDDVLAVLHDRQWDLDGSGRLPRSKRVTTPRGLRIVAAAAAPLSRSRPVADRRFEEPLEQQSVDVLSTGRCAVADEMLLEEARASVALDGETQIIGGAYTATEPRTPPGPAPVPRISFIAVLKASELGVDHSYQRPLDEPRVRRMVAAWDPRMVGTIDVSDRGPDELPRYAVINGQHRAAAAARVSPEGAQVGLACVVHEGLGVAEEAALMRELDRTTKKLTGFDQWRARSVAGDPLVAEVEAIARIHGLRIAPDNADGVLRSYGSAEKLVKLGGANLLDNTIGVLRAAYGTAASVYQGPLLMGVGQLLHRESDVDVGRLRNALANTAPEKLRAAATALREVEGGPLSELMTRAIAGQYNRTAGGGPRLAGRS